MDPEGIMLGEKDQTGKQFKILYVESKTKQWAKLQEKRLDLSLTEARGLRGGVKERWSKATNSQLQDKQELGM